MYYGDHRRIMEMYRTNAIEHSKDFSIDVQIVTATSTLKWMRLAGGVISKNGHALRLVGTKQDITAQRGTLDRLREKANFDPLTGLANRNVFERGLDSLKAGAHPEITGILMIDLDNFKHINDRWGHPCGDECLRQVGERLRTMLGEWCLVTRFGGDEFAAFVMAPFTPATLKHRLAQIMDRLSAPVAWGVNLIAVSLSIGASIRRDESGCDLLARADASLYQAKQSRTRKIVLCSDAA